MITVAEGGGMFAVAQQNRPVPVGAAVPYDDPNVNMNVSST